MSGEKFGHFLYLCVSGEIHQRCDSKGLNFRFLFLRGGSERSDLAASTGDTRLDRIISLNQPDHSVPAGCCPVEPTARHMKRVWQYL